ncbi:MAG: hypothetical protein KGI54_14650 [Pseudomonadota bacterium]|nr:hypothetical protein [Pseudomonadota bacterium]
MSNPGPASSTTGNLVAPIGNTEESLVLSLALTPAIVAPNTTAEQTFTSTGAGISSAAFIAVNKPTAQAGLGIVGARAVAADAIGITFSNNTAATITPTAGETYLVKVENPLSQGGVAQTITQAPY